MQSPIWRQPARREAQKDCGGSRSPPAPRDFLSAAPGGKKFREAGLASIKYYFDTAPYFAYQSLLKKSIDFMTGEIKRIKTPEDSVLILNSAPVCRDRAEIPKHTSFQSENSTSAPHGQNRKIFENRRSTWT